MSRPITPSEVWASTPPIPDEVYDIFNKHIAKNMRRGKSVVPQSVVLWEIAKTLSISDEDVCARGLLDIEMDYERAGWDVRYDKPGYNETYEASFTFTAKDKP